MKSSNIVRRSSYAIGSGFGFAGTGSRANGIMPPEMSGWSPCLIKSLDKVFDRADKLDRAEAKPGLVVIGMGLEDRAEGFWPPARSPEIKYFSVTWRSSAAGARAMATVERTTRRGQRA